MLGCGASGRFSRQLPAGDIALGELRGPMPRKPNSGETACGDVDAARTARGHNA